MVYRELIAWIVWNFVLSDPRRSSISKTVERIQIYISFDVGIRRQKKLAKVLYPQGTWLDRTYIRRWDDESTYQELAENVIRRLPQEHTESRDDRAGVPGRHLPPLHHLLGHIESELGAEARHLLHEQRPVIHYSGWEDRTKCQQQPLRDQTILYTI